MSTPSLIQEVRKRSGWSIFMGVHSAALGLFLIAYPMATATIWTVLFGWTLIFVGIAQFVFALHSRHADHRQAAAPFVVPKNVAEVFMH
jgi:uncharacterized membrane protein HdeD (DUF308 family)